MQTITFDMASQNLKNVILKAIKDKPEGIGPEDAFENVQNNYCQESSRRFGLVQEKR